MPSAYGWNAALINRGQPDFNRGKRQFNRGKSDFNRGQTTIQSWQMTLQSWQKSPNPNVFNECVDALGQKSICNLLRIFGRRWAHGTNCLSSATCSLLAECRVLNG